MADNIYWSTIYLGNLAEMDTNEGSHTVETAAPVLTTFGAGPGNSLAGNIVTVETDAGFLDDSVTTDNDWLDYDYVHYDLGSGSQTARIDAALVLNATVTFYDQSTLVTTIPVFQDTSGNVFMVIQDSKPELASQGIDSVTFTSVVSSDYTGITQDAMDDHDFVCLTAGARVETPVGPVRMDRLRRGDLVLTLDSGPQPIRWIGKRRHRFEERPHPGQPIRIDKGAFGPGLPRRDLILSPNHRVLLKTEASHALHDPLGALAPAKALTRLPHVRRLTGRREITYFNLLLPRHEVIIADGIAVESLFPGPEVFASLDGIERSDWLRLAARDGRLTGAPPARLMLTTAETRAGLDAGLMHAPATAPVRLTWSGARHRARPMPSHLSRRA